MRRLLFSVVFALTFVSASLAQCTVHVPIGIFDRSESVPLPPNAKLQVKIDGKTAVIRSVRPNSRPPRVAIVLDLSGSMSGDRAQQPWKQAVAIAKGLLQALAENAQIAIVVVNEKDKQVTGFGQTREVLRARLDAITGSDVNGRTPLWDTLRTTLTTVFGRAELGDAIFLLSDGEDNISKEHEERIEKELVLRETRLFALILNGLDFRAPDEELRRETFDRLTANTGGAVLPLAVADKEFGKVGRGITIGFADRVSHFADVAFEVPAATKPFPHFSAVVVDDRGRGLKGIAAAFPKHIVACNENHSSQP
jgi:Mg-chelatase subunit ChlD